MPWIGIGCFQEHADVDDPRRNQGPMESAALFWLWVNRHDSTEYQRPFVVRTGRRILRRYPENHGLTADERVRNAHLRQRIGDAIEPIGKLVHVHGVALPQACFFATHGWNLHLDFVDT